MTHVRVILPAYAPKACNMQMLKQYETPELTISLTYGEVEATSARSEIEMHLLSNTTIKKIIEAQNEGVDAIVINIMAEFSLSPMLEVASVPLVTLPKIAFNTASMLSDKFTIVSTTPSVYAMQTRLIQKYGLTDRFASFRCVSFLPEYDYDAPENIEALLDVCVKAIEEDHAGAIIFGSGRVVGITEPIKQALLKKGYDIPLIEALPLGIKYAKLLADLKLKQSKIDYPLPSVDVTQLLGL